MPHRRSALSTLMTARETASHQRRRWVAIVAMVTIVAMSMTIVAMTILAMTIAWVAIVAWVASVAFGGHRGLGCGLVSWMTDGRSEFH